MNEKKCKCGECRCGKKDEGGMGGPKGYDRTASNEPYRDDEGGMGGPKGY